MSSALAVLSPPIMISNVPVSDGEGDSSSSLSSGIPSSPSSSTTTELSSESPSPPSSPATLVAASPPPPGSGEDFDEKMDVCSQDGSSTPGGSPGGASVGSRVNVGASTSSSVLCGPRLKRSREAPKQIPKLHFPGSDLVNAHHSLATGANCRKRSRNQLGQCSSHSFPESASETGASCCCSGTITHEEAPIGARREPPAAAAATTTAATVSIWARRMMGTQAEAPFVDLTGAPVIEVPRKRNGFVVADVTCEHVEPHEIEEMDSHWLASIILESSMKVLILDCRSFLDYNIGHVINAVNVWCSKLLNRRLQQNKVTAQEVLRNTFHLEVGEAELVIIYDEQSSCVDDLEDQGFTKTLMDKLRLSFRTVAFLKGGFQEFSITHPDLCSDSSRWRPILKTLSQPCLASSYSPDGVRGGRATRILPFLYLGSEQDALDPDFLQSHNIEYILNLSLQIPKPDGVADSHFMRIPVHDSPNEKLLPHFLQAFQFLDMVQEVGGNVLVHCFAGISRSPTLVIGYVMDRLHLSSEEAFRYVKSKRAVVAPNFNFLGQLLEYDQHLKSRLRTNLHKVHTAPATSAPLEFSWELSQSPKQGGILSPGLPPSSAKFYLRSPSLVKAPNVGS